MQDVERVMLAAEALSGDHDKAAEWLSQPLDTFGGKTPLRLIAEGRTESLIGYLHSRASDQFHVYGLALARRVFEEQLEDVD